MSYKVIRYKGSYHEEVGVYGDYNRCADWVDQDDDGLTWGLRVVEYH